MLSNKRKNSENNISKNDNNGKEEEEEEDDEEQFQSDFSEEEKRHREMKNRYKAGNKSKNPTPEVSNLMKEANINYILEDFQKAEEICKQIIELQENYIEPYNLLGLMYEDNGRIKEAADYYLWAAYIQRTDAKTWEKIAYLYKKENEFEQAGYCFGRALKSDTMNINLWKQRAICYESIGELRKAIKCVKRIIDMEDQNSKYIKHCAKLYWKNNNPEKCLEILRDLMQKQDLEENFDVINMISEIYLKQKEYQKLDQFLEETFTLSQMDEEQFKDILDNLPLILLKVFIVVYSQLKNKEKEQMVLQILLEKDDNDIEEYEVNQYKDIAENLENINQNESTYKIYEKLLKLPNLTQQQKDEFIENQINSFIKMKKSQTSQDQPNYQNMINECIDYTKDKLQLIPKSQKIRTELSNLYLESGDGQKAYEVLDEMFNKLNDQIDEYDNDNTLQDQEQIQGSQEKQGYLNNKNNSNYQQLNQQQQNLQYLSDQDIEYQNDIDMKQEGEGMYNQAQVRVEYNGFDFMEDGTSNKQKSYSSDFGDDNDEEDEFGDSSDESEYEKDESQSYDNKDISNQISDESELIQTDQYKQDELDEDIYYSDEEGQDKEQRKEQIKQRKIIQKQNELIKQKIQEKSQKQQLKNKRKKKNSQDDSDYDVMEDIKKQRKIENLGHISSQAVKQEEKSLGNDKSLKGTQFFEKKTLEKKQIQNKYNFQDMLLAYQKGIILFKNPQYVDEEKLNLVYNQARSSLNLEKELSDFTKQINNKLLLITQKKTFKFDIKAPNYLEKFDKTNELQIINNKKHDNDQVLLKKKKKQAKALTEEQVQDVETLSKKYGQKEYIEFIKNLLKMMSEKNMHQKVLKICSLTAKLNFLKEKEFASEKDIIYNYGLSSSILTENYEKAFLFLKYIMTTHQNSMYLAVILNQIFNKIKNGAIYRAFINQLSKKTEKWDKFNQIIVNGFMETANYDLAINKLGEQLVQDPKNSLLNLQMCACYLQQVTQRVKFNKEELSRMANIYFDIYQHTRGQEYKMEITYNLGRFFSHLKLNNKALSYFQQVIDQYIYKKNRKLIITQNDRSLFLKAAHNISITHKQMGNNEIAQWYLDNFLNIDVEQ